MSDSIMEQPRIYRPAPRVKRDEYALYDERTLNEVRPQYKTPDAWMVPGVIIRNTTPSGAHVVAFGKYAVVRDRLTEKYGGVTIIHDELIPHDDVSCWPSCRGAFKKQWWMCGCPCGGLSHASENWLLNYTLVSEEYLPSFIPFCRLRRTTYTYAIKEAAA